VIGDPGMWRIFSHTNIMSERWIVFELTESEACGEPSPTLLSGQYTLRSTSNSKSRFLLDVSDRAVVKLDICEDPKLTQVTQYWVERRIKLNLELDL
jgi:hypothetical protein